MAKSYSNFYIFRFAFIMVVIVATGLSLSFALLKPYQEENKRIEKIQYLLQAAGIPSEKKEATEIYIGHLIAEMVLSPEDGEPLSIWLPDSTFRKGDQRAFDIDMKKLLAARKMYSEGKISEKPGLPLFLLRNDKGDTLYVIPVRGRGLWGPVWGNIAMGTDRNIITGTTFDHQGETPGLGAEINTLPFQERFKGKALLDKDGNFTSVRVVKGDVKTFPEDEKIHSVDAISGGTITSNGVSAMIKDCLSYYEPFFKKAK